jgi:hypothetical protein
LKVIVEQAEGLSADCVPQTYEGPDCVERANQYLCRIAANCPDLGYDVTITWDGTDYTFRFEKTTTPTVRTIRVCASDKHKLGAFWYIRFGTDLTGAKQPVVDMCRFLGSLPTPEQMAKRRAEEAKITELRWVSMGQQFEGTDPITDTSKLMVGQDVWVSSVDQGFIEGKVVKVTPEGADVQATGQGIIHFNSKGYLPSGTIRDPAYWRIDSLPFAERRAMLERGRQKTMAVGQKVWMQSGDEFKEGTVKEVTEYYVEVVPADDEECSIEFSYNGTQLGSWGGIDGFDVRPMCGQYPSFMPWRLVTDDHSAAEAFMQKREDFLRKREAFVERYCKEHGLRKHYMTKEQCSDLCKEEGWKNPQ